MIIMILDLDNLLFKQLLCSCCQSPLSCFPIMVNCKGTTFCGRCYDRNKLNQHEILIKNEAYETVAILLKFPCKYYTKGCKARLCVSEVLQHEKSCTHTEMNCPIIIHSKKCCWVGKKILLRDHLYQDHKDLFCHYPCTQKPDIKKKYETHYLMSMNSDLFLIQVRRS